MNRKRTDVSSRKRANGHPWRRFRALYATALLLMLEKRAIRQEIAPTDKKRMNCPITWKVCQPH